MLAVTRIIEWPDLVALVIVGTPAIIAAISSLRNGKQLRENHRSERIPAGKKPKKNGKTPDWYAPPDL